MACAPFDAHFRTAFPEGDIQSLLPQGWAMWCTVVAALLLVLRRRFPVAVAAVITGGLLLGTGSVLATIVAYYSLARHTPRLRTVFIAAPTGLLLILGIAAWHLRRYAPLHGTVFSQETVLIVFAGLIAVVLPVLAGLYPRTPRQPWWWEHRSAMLFDILLVLFFPLANPIALVSGLNGAQRDPLLLPAPVVVMVVMVQGWRCSGGGGIRTRSPLSRCSSSRSSCRPSASSPSVSTRWRSTGRRGAISSSAPARRP